MIAILFVYSLIISEISNSEGTRFAMQSNGPQPQVFGVKVDHVARGEDRCGRAAAVVVSRHIVLRLGQRRLGFFERVLHPVRELVNCFNVGRRLMWFEAHLRVLAGIEEEGRLLRGGVDVVVVGELRQGEECVPVVLSFSDEEPSTIGRIFVS